MTNEAQQTPQPPTNPTPKQPVGFDWKWFYFSFNGRINRQPFWLYYVVPAFILNMLLNFMIPAVGMIVALVLLWVGLAVGAKRCHDRGKSGWWQLLLIVPLVGIVWFIVDLGILEGTEGENQYGSDPLK